MARGTWWPVTVGAWVIACRLTPQGDDVVVSEMRVFPRNRRKLPDGGLTTDVVRSVKLADVRDDARRILRALASDDEPMGLVFDEADWSAVWDRLGERRTHLAQVAALYAQAVEEGDPSPNRTVAERMDTTPERVRDWLYKARQAGLLTPAPGRGRAGGGLTERARKLLAA